MSKRLLTSTATLAEERDPIWEAMLASPVVEDDLNEEELAAFEEGMADIRAGRVVSRERILEAIERMRREEERKIIAAMASIDAGRGLAFEEVFQDLEVVLSENANGKNGET